MTTSQYWHAVRAELNDTELTRLSEQRLQELASPEALETQTPEVCAAEILNAYYLQRNWLAIVGVALLSSLRLCFCCLGLMAMSAFKSK